MTIFDYIKTIQHNFLPSPESCIPSKEIENINWLLSGIGNNATFYDDDTLYIQVSIFRMINVCSYYLVPLYYKDKRGQIDQYLANLILSFPGLKNKLSIYDNKLLMEELLNLHLDFTKIDCDVLSHIRTEKHEI